MQHKQAGNELYAQKKFLEAIQHYDRGVAEVRRIPRGNLSAPQKTLLLALHNNKAMCLIELKKYRAALAELRECLGVECAKNFKLYHRKAVCEIQLGYHHDAVVSIHIGFAICGGGGDDTEQMAALQELLRTVPGFEARAAATVAHAAKVRELSHAPARQSSFANLLAHPDAKKSFGEIAALAANASCVFCGTNQAMHSSLHCNYKKLNCVDCCRRMLMGQIHETSSEDSSNTRLTHDVRFSPLYVAARLVMRELIQTVCQGRADETLAHVLENLLWRDATSLARFLDLDTMQARLVAAGKELQDAVNSGAGD